jgi:hypothetical protein
MSLNPFGAESPPTGRTNRQTDPGSFNISVIPDMRYLYISPGACHSGKTVEDFISSGKFILGIDAFAILNIEANSSIRNLKRRAFLTKQVLRRRYAEEHAQIRHKAD